jgi:hypothetical protein
MRNLVVFHIFASEPRPSKLYFWFVVLPPCYVNSPLGSVGLSAVHHNAPTDFESH